MLERVCELLKGSFWKLDLSRVKLSRLELDFLSNFFDVLFEREVDDLTVEERAYLVLRKKQKFISNPAVN
jgi:hypothetical protein